ncbi:MAG TPA: dethiobiotin synthase [Terriglobia bacterium]|nr:dethiobiotin synthase [Terriglobia bacterium]
MLRGVFVTGVDTGIGKTVVAAALLARYNQLKNVVYWKPVQTGIEADDDTATVRRLSSCRPDQILDRGIRLPRPLSPHLAARLAGVHLTIAGVVEPVAEREDRNWIVEGAGGVLVPLNEQEMMTDLMARLALPAVVVTRTTLGTINHTLLTLEALRRRGIDIAGVVLVGPHNPENRHAIEHFGRAPTLGEMPRFSPLTPDALTTWARADLDPSGLLSACFRP